MLEEEARRLMAAAANDSDAPSGTPTWLRLERMNVDRVRRRQIRFTAVTAAACMSSGLALGLASHGRVDHPVGARVEPTAAGTPHSTASVTVTTEVGRAVHPVVAHATTTVTAQNPGQPGPARTVTTGSTPNPHAPTPATSTQLVRETTTTTVSATETVVTLRTPTVTVTVTVTAPPPTSPTQSQSPTESLPPDRG